MSEARTSMIPSFDGTELAVHRLGAGRPVLLLHGLFSSAYMNWIDFGHAAALVDAGFEAVMPDSRAHGESARPHNVGAYPHDVLVRDVQALVDALGLDDFDLVGFSLGARTAARAVLEGVAPRRLVLAGMGLEGLSGWERRGAFFIDAIDRFDSIRAGDPAFMAKGFMTRMRTDRVAARLLLGSIGNIDRAELAGISMPTMVLCGRKDRDNGSPQALTSALPHARHVEIPGTHMSSVTEGALGDALVEFLDG
ncbi:alpha/beta fold hydrolase [Parerythrobacter lacustris]|uniref:Alpha/beta hydrolase n=1 Tax=Parerythrobacter lacustris TaxID=2969984 RepID=A0ABT1XSI2_9SPHN|nr:alpha/beta hydrolase [Parerythrobacter lacustris]MCR2834618.1 alpha/beta hydrolase [Parerythrobacter lacustris]